MHKHFLLGTGFLLMLCAAASAAPPRLVPGDYLNDDFLRVLKQTRSPQMAMAQGTPQSIAVIQENNGLRFDANNNWHEGYTLYTLRPDGALKRGEQKLDYPKPKIDSSRHFQFKEAQPNSIWRGYTYVGNADVEITKIALGGTYIDKNNRLYEFGLNTIPQKENVYPIYYGVLKSMGPDVPFYLENDHIGGNDFDYFYLKDPSKTAIAFKNDGNHLYLYPIKLTKDNTMNIGEPDFAHPLLVLKRIVLSKKR